jgi:predicted nucleotidyltransferase
MSSLAQYAAGFRQRQERLWAEREEGRQAIRSALIPTLRAIGERNSATVGRLILFGSVIVPGRLSAHSDIDVAVEWRQRGDYWGLWREIEEAIARDVDFRELSGDPFSERVRAHGMVVFEG